MYSILQQPTPLRLVRRPICYVAGGGDPVPGASRCFISVLNRNSKLENIAPCYSSNKLCGPIQGEVKNKTSRNQNRYYERHGMHTGWPARGLSRCPCPNQNSKIQNQKSSPLFPQ